MSEERPGMTAEEVIALPSPRPHKPGQVTFYCAVEGKPSNQVICLGGERRMDASNRVINMPAKHMEFVQGIFRTGDADQINALRELAQDQYTGITEDREAFLQKTLPPEKNIERQQRKLEEDRKEVNRLREELLAGKAPEGPKVNAGPIGSGSVPRRKVVTA